MRLFSAMCVLCFSNMGLLVGQLTLLLSALQSLFSFHCHLICIKCLFTLLDNASVSFVLWIQRSFSVYYRLPSCLDEVSHFSFGFWTWTFRVWLDGRGGSQTKREITLGLHGCSKDQVTSLYQLLVLAKPDQGIERQYHEYTETNNRILNKIWISECNSVLGTIFFINENESLKL